MILVAAYQIESVSCAFAAVDNYQTALGTACFFCNTFKGLLAEVVIQAFFKAAKITAVCYQMFSSALGYVFGKQLIIVWHGC